MMIDDNGIHVVVCVWARPYCFSLLISRKHGVGLGLDGAGELYRIWLVGWMRGVVPPFADM